MLKVQGTSRSDLAEQNFGWNGGVGLKISNTFSPSQAASARTGAYSKD